jgi:hypothetical protein
MLDIRINFTINVKKVAASVAAVILAFSHIVGTPAYAETFAEFYPNEKVATVSLTYMSVSTTRSAAIKAINSPYVKYFDAETLAFLTTYAKGVSKKEWSCLDNLWKKESHFNPKALNMHSKAFGIAQFLPSTWGNYNLTKTAEAQLQIKYGLHYIEKRYGSLSDPSGICSAWEFHQRKGWY